MLALEFSLVYLVPFSLLIGSLLGGYFTFLTPFLVFGVVPLLDILIGKDTHNPQEEEKKILQRRPIFKRLTCFCAPLQVLVVFWGAYIITHKPLSLLEL